MMAMTIQPSQVQNFHFTDSSTPVFSSQPRKKPVYRQMQDKIGFPLMPEDLGFCFQNTIILCIIISIRSAVIPFITHLCRNQIHKKLAPTLCMNSISQENWSNYTDLCGHKEGKNCSSLISCGKLLQKNNHFLGSSSAEMFKS